MERVPKTLEREFIKKLFWKKVFYKFWFLVGKMAILRMNYILQWSNFLKISMKITILTLKFEENAKIVFDITVCLFRHFICATFNNNSGPFSHPNVWKSSFLVEKHHKTMVWKFSSIENYKKNCTKHQFFPAKISTGRQSHLIIHFFPSTKEFKKSLIRSMLYFIILILFSAITTNEIKLKAFNL